MILDEYFEKVHTDNPNMLVPQFLIASYLYYIEDKSIISDHLFDKMCKELLNNWNQIEHRHKHLITEGDLRAGTGFALKEEDYPNIVKNSAKKLLQKGPGSVMVSEDKPLSANLPSEETKKQDERPKTRPVVEVDTHELF